MKRILSIKNDLSKGITLIALVITVVVLVIIGGVAVGLTIGENGIIAKTKQAAEKNRYEDARERILIKIAEIKIKRIEQGKECNLEDIYIGFADEEKDYYVDDIIFYEISAVRNNIAQKRTENSEKTLKQIIVSHSVAEEYKFLLGEDGEIQGIGKSDKPDDPEEIKNILFIPKEEFEEKINNGSSSNPTDLENPNNLNPYFSIEQPEGGTTDPNDWTNSEVTLVLPTKEYYTTQYQTGSKPAGTWLIYDDSNRPKVNNNTTVFYRYSYENKSGPYNSFEINNIDKTNPTLNIETSYTASTKVLVINANAQDYGSTIDYCTYSVILEGTEKNTDPTLKSNTIQNVVDGVYDITVVAKDKAGNTAEQTKQVVITDPDNEHIGDTVVYKGIEFEVVSIAGNTGFLSPKTLTTQKTLSGRMGGRQDLLDEAVISALNDACNNAYKDDQKGVTARNITESEINEGWYKAETNKDYWIPKTKFERYGKADNVVYYAIGTTMQSSYYSYIYWTYGGAESRSATHYICPIVIYNIQNTTNIGENRFSL